MTNDVAAVVIGRNEGARLKRCLESLQAQVRQLVYVDSGSTDDSVALAQALGADVIVLDKDRPFTAARARNTGVANLQNTQDLNFVQFVDGDCEVRSDWIAVARQAMADHPRAAVVCGRRRERFPDATFWNRLADEEWEAPAGLVKACGGDALMRIDAFREVGGFNPSMIAGEEPELCLRLRGASWEVWRLNAEMTLHDAAMTRFSQWWQRQKRAGYTYAEGVAMHGASPERHNVTRLQRTLIWSISLPVLISAGLAITPWAALLVLIWPLQVLRLMRRKLRPSSATFLVLSRFAELQGVLTWAWRRLRGRQAQLIEYK